jgi:hypothetical protein
MADARFSPATLNGDGKGANNVLKGTWIATLSNGDTVAEHTGNFEFLEGEPTPWVRLTHFVGDNQLHLTSLRFNFNGRTVHMPRTKLDKFGFAERNRPPAYYSLQYHHEAEMDMTGELKNREFFVDLAAHYPQFAVHFIQDLQQGDNSWVVVTDPGALAPTRRDPDWKIK